MADKTPAEQLAGLRDLQEGWDSYGAPPIDQRAIDAAAKFLEPWFVPTSHGGVQVEIRWGGGAEVGVEFGPEGTVVAFTWDREG